MKTLISSSLVLLILLSAHCLNAQDEKKISRLFHKGLRITSGFGYMKELKNDRVSFGMPSKELSSPNSAFITWISLSYNQSKGWFLQSSLDFEHIDETDLNKKFWLRSLHFSVGKQVLWAGKDIRLFTGLSTVKRIGLTGAFTQLPSGQITYKLSEGQTTGFLFPHLGTEFLSDISGSFQLGLRIKVISSLNDFGRIDISGFLSYSF